MKKIKIIFSLILVTLLSSCNQKAKTDNPTSTSSSNSSTIYEEYQKWFEEQSIIPETITETINLPRKFPATGNRLNWTIKEGAEHLILQNYTLSLRENVAKTSGVHEIQVNVDRTKFTYSYYCTSHHNNYHDLPVIDSHTENNEFPEGKEEYVKGTLSLINFEDKNYAIDLLNAPMGIRLRGNSTMPALKKPFRIKFDKKQSLFGLKKAKSWVLLANFFDKSNIRNYLAYTMAREMDNLGFQPSSIFVEVRFNNDFMGLYLLCEQMQTGEGRVDIEDDRDENNMPSYMLELNERAIGEGLIEDEEYFVTDLDRKFIFEYKFPEPPTPQENEYIKNYIIETDRAITSLTNYEDYIDVDSFIDYYLVQEAFKNVDIGSTSQFYVKYANGKLNMGPVWDFDICLGVVGGEVYEYYNTTDLWVRNADHWYRSLFKDSTFLNKVKIRYKEIKPIIENVLTNMDQLKIDLQKAQEANLERWPLSYLNNPDLWIETHYHEDYMALNSLDEHYTYLKNQFLKRVSILDTHYFK